MDSGRHDSNLAVARRNDSRTIGADQPRAPVLQELPGADHIERRDALGDADNQLQLGVGCLHDRVGGVRWRHKDHGGVGRGLFHSFLDRIEDRPALVRRASLARGYAPDNLRPIFRARPGMECAFPPGQPLHNHPRRFIYQNAHSSLLSTRCHPERSQVIRSRMTCRSRRTPIASNAMPL